MVRVPLRTKNIRGVVSNVTSFPAPVNGWNTRDSLASMSIMDAVSLDNFVPKNNYCETRGGWTAYATGTTGNIKTLAPYNAINGVNKLFAYTASGIYDVTSVGAVGASKLARTNGKHQYEMFGDGTSNWLIACNGVDKPAYFDGTTWTAVDGATTPALTGVTSSNLIQPCVYKGRLFFVEVNTLSVWYLAAGAAGGALTEFDLSAQFKRGGYLMRMAVWTRDAGDGQDDVACFISSEGEIAVYQGDNPSVSTSWAKIGSYFIGRPLGRRCTVQLGGDLAIITEGGLFPLSRAIVSANVDYREALSYKIEPTFTASARAYSGVFGWETIVYPQQSVLIVNSPQAEDGVHYQYVMNTITQAWCRFTGWSLETFALLDGVLYGANGTGTRKLWDGPKDGSDNIVFYGKTAFSYYRSPGNLKKFKMYKPNLISTGSISFLTDIDVDFRDTDIVGTSTFSSSAGAQWDVAQWDIDVWGGSPSIVRQWTSPVEWDGYCAAMKLKIETNSVTVQWVANDVAYEMGGIA